VADEMLDEEMSDIDNRKRAGDSEVACETVIQVRYNHSAIPIVNSFEGPCLFYLYCKFDCIIEKGNYSSRAFNRKSCVSGWRTVIVSCRFNAAIVQRHVGKST